MIGIITAIAPIIGSAIDAIFPDKTESEKAKAEVNKALIENADKIEKAAADIVLAEARGDGFIQKNWRPLTMLVFLGMVVSYWFGYTPPNATPELVSELFVLIKIGLGGYVVGRSAEKIIPGVIKAMNK
tara:strand:+ start:21 stop:407 length:387 start_codon:yes stop_codon:yes gene_type:complete